MKFEFPTTLLEKLEARLKEKAEEMVSAEMSKEYQDYDKGYWELYCRDEADNRVGYKMDDMYNEIVNRLLEDLE